MNKVSSRRGRAKGRKPSRLALLGVSLALLTGLLAGVPPATAGGGSESNGSPTGQFRNLDELLAEVGERIPSFGGSYVAGEALHIWMTTPDQEAAERVAAALDPIYDEDLSTLAVQVREATYAFTDLKRWHDSMRMNIWNAVPDLVFSGFDERHNQLVIGLENLQRDKAAAEAELRRLQVPLDAVRIKDSAPVVAQSNLSTYHRPLVGGLHIEFSPNNYWCTHGFTANRSGQRGFVTAAHCSGAMAQMDGASYGQPTLSDGVGSEVADPSFFSGGSCPSGYVCRNSDSNFVERFSGVEGQRQIARTGIGTHSWDGSVYRITQKASGSPTIGIRLNKVGRTTGRTRGDVRYNCLDTAINSTTMLLCQVHVEAVAGETPISSGGDSGAPWFRITNSPQTYDVKLMGVHWGGSSDDVWAIYSKVAQVESELGTLNVCYSGFSC